MNYVHNEGPLYQKGRSWRSTIGYVYEWGAMFVRMLEHTVSTEVFHMTMRRYINKYQYGNVDHELLWAELEFVNPFQDEKVSMSTIFNSWIYQRGGPLLRVSRSNKSTTESTLLLNQVPYPGWDGNSEVGSSRVWFIPITYIMIYHKDGTYARTSNTTFVHRYLMPNTSDTVPMHLQTTTKSDRELVAILNVNFTGTFHVAYDEDEWKRIGEVLMKNPSVIPMVNRLQLLWSLKMSLRWKEVTPDLLLCIGEYVKVCFFFFIV